MTRRLDGKTAYITGAGSGIGKATASVMVREGAAVAVVDVNGEAAESVADRLRSAGAKAIALQVDVKDPEAVRASYDETVERLGRLDVLHLNAAAGSPVDTNVVDTDLSVWQDVFDVNVMGVVHGLKFGIPKLLEHGGGSIVLTSSMGGETGDLLRASYGSLKATVTAITKYVSSSHGRAGININAVLPGLVLSEGAAVQFPKPLADAVVKHQTTDRLTQPEDVAELVAFLASDAAIAIRGQAIAIDAGHSAQGASSPTLAAAIQELQAAL